MFASWRLRRICHVLRFDKRFHKESYSMELDCAIQKYEWGKLGSDSLVARCYRNVHPDFTIEENAPYAELWMGTHPNGPSLIRETGQKLSDVIAKNPNYLGGKVREVFGDDLPYLFKVLSVNKALSIQVHPAKQHAKELHAKRPDLYKDPNHKPEMAVALTKFEALCGFRPISEIKTFIKDIKQLRSLVSEDAAAKLLNACEDSYKQELQACFYHLMNCPQEKVTAETQTLLQSLSTEGEDKTRLGQLFQRLNSQFPNDIGCFAIYFLNFLSLEPLEAIYLGANEPHAYLYGDCIECMACSDNTIRAGLTPKFKDVETLCSMLNYHGEPPKSKLFEPVIEDSFHHIFKPPIPDFAVVKIEAPVKAERLTLRPRSTASILLNVAGKAHINEKEFVPGKVLFIPADDIVYIEGITEDLLLFQALANV